MKKFPPTAFDSRTLLREGPTSGMEVVCAARGRAGMVRLLVR